MDWQQGQQEGYQFMSFAEYCNVRQFLQLQLTYQGKPTAVFHPSDHFLSTLYSMEAHWQRMVRMADGRVGRDSGPIYVPPKNEGAETSFFQPAFYSSPVKTEPKKKKAGKKNLPKRPLSSFMLFLKDVRPKIKEMKRNASTTEINSEAGTMWNQLPSNEKEKYTQEANKLLLKWQKDNGIDVKSSQRSATAYEMWLKDNRQQLMERYGAKGLKTLRKVAKVEYDGLPQSVKDSDCKQVQVI